MSLLSFDVFPIATYSNVMVLLEIFVLYSAAVSGKQVWMTFPCNANNKGLTDARVVLFTVSR
jgi:hypothetical protein